jgi:hypothetical protein
MYLSGIEIARKKQGRFIAKFIIIIFNQFFSINQHLKNPAYFLILIFFISEQNAFCIFICLFVTT